MDVLLKQDVDLGFSLIPPDATTKSCTEKAIDTAGASGKVQYKDGNITASGKKLVCSGSTDDDIQKWNALLEIKSAEV